MPVLIVHLGFEDPWKILVEYFRRARYPNSFFYSILLCEKCFNPLPVAIVCGRRGEE
jgi:hypothetical protein